MAHVHARKGRTHGQARLAMAPMPYVHARGGRAHRLASWGAGLAACLVAATWCGVVARADEAGGVVVTGDVVPEAPNHFRWIIKNNGTGNIVLFRAPRHLGLEAVMPPRWSYELPAGATETSGDVLYRADVPAAGIGPGETGTFEIHDMRLQRVGRTKRAADVVVGFADGSELVLSGVLCPAEETIIEKNIPLFGLGGMFAIFLIAQAVRKRRRGAEQAGPSCRAAEKQRGEGLARVCDWWHEPSSGNER